MPPFRIGTLGEIAIRCNDLPAMFRFYKETLGLEPMSGDESASIVFFRLSNGIAGHTTVLALFAHDAPDQRDVHPKAAGTIETGAQSSLHHFALSLEYTEQEKAIRWFDEIRQDYRIEMFDWVGWRGVFTNDPDGNTVELVSKVGG